jgi:hypothetical protein
MVFVHENSAGFPGQTFSEIGMAHVFSMDRRALYESRVDGEDYRLRLIRTSGARDWLRKRKWNATAMSWTKSFWNIGVINQTCLVTSGQRTVK